MILVGICKDILLLSQFSGLVFIVLVVNVLCYFVSLEKNEKQEGRGGLVNIGYVW